LLITFEEKICMVFSIWLFLQYQINRIMVTQTYIFRNLPPAIINDDNERGLKWSRGVEDDINAEIGMYLNTRWAVEETYGKNLILRVDVPEEFTEDLRCCLQNLHTGQLI